MAAILEARWRADAKDDNQDVALRQHAGQSHAFALAILA